MVKTTPTGAGDDGVPDVGGTESLPTTAQLDAAGAQRRVDARRNYEQLVEGAVRVLAENPAASLQDIAREVGLHRATLHRHFRSREDLMDAVRDRAAARTQGWLSTVEQAGLSPGDALEAMVRTFLVEALPDRMWRFATYRGTGWDEHRTDIMNRIEAVMAGAQQVGAVRADLSARALVLVWGGINIAMLPVVSDGELQVDEAVGLMLTVLRSVPAG